MKFFKSAKTFATDNILDIGITVAISLIFFVCPLFFSGLVFQGSGFEKMILFYFLVLIGIILWISKGVVQGKLELKKTPIDWFLLGLFIIYSLSTIYSVNQKDSLIGSLGSPTKGFLALLVFILFYYLLVNNINLKKIKLYFILFVSSSALVLIYSFFQLLGIYLLPFNFTHSNVFNPIGSITALTMFLIAILPLLMIAFAQLDEFFPKLKRSFSYVIKSLIFIVVLLDFFTLSLLTNYTFWPAAMIGVVAILMFFLSKVIKTSRISLAFFIGVFILLIAQLSLGKFSFVNINLPNEVSLTLKSSWDIAKTAVMKDPFLGSGPATFAYDFAAYKDPQFNYTNLWQARFDSSSSILLELAATIGLIGTLIALSLILTVVTSGFLAMIKAENSEEKSLILALFTSLIVVVVYILFFTVDVSAYLVFALIAIMSTSLIVKILTSKNSKILKLSFRSSPQYALALSALVISLSAGATVLFIMGFKLFLADVYAAKSIVAQSFEERVEKMSKAIQLAPYQDSYYIALANDYLLLSDQEAKKDGKKEAVANYLSSAINAGRKAVEIEPNNVSNIESLALVYENASFYDQAALSFSEELYQKNIGLDPNNPNPNLRLGLINMARANLIEDDQQKQTMLNNSIKYFDEAISKKKDLAAAYYGKAIVLEKLSKNDESIEQMKIAAGLTNSVDYNYELGRLYYNRAVGQSAKENINSFATSTEINVSVVKKNDLELSEKIFSNILSVSPNHSNSLYSLALLYKKIGDNENSKKMLEKLLEILPDEKSKEAVKGQFPGIY